MDISSGGAGQGAETTIKVGAVSGDAFTGSTYVWAEEEANVGQDVDVLILADIAGTPTTITLTREPQRIEASLTATGTGAAQLRVRGALANAATAFRIGAAHAVKSISAVPRSFDDGQSIFSHIGPRRVNALRAIQEVADNELGGYCYVNGSGTLVFEDRHHRWRVAASTASQGTIDETMVDVPYEEEADDLIGEVELGYVRWEEGAADSTVFQLFPVPRQVPANGTLTVDGDYGAIVRDFTVPVANTDYFIRSQPESDTAGSDETGNVTLAFEDFGGGFQAVFTSSVAYPVHLTSFKVRATPVRIASDQPQEVYTPSGAPDYASKLRFSYRLASSQPDVEAWATYLGDRYVTQRERLPVRLLNKTAAILTEMTDRLISDRVTIINDNTAYSSKVNGAYYIDAIRYRLSQGKTKMEVILSVVPADDNFWILGTGELDEADTTKTTNTVLAP